VDELSTGGFAHGAAGDATGGGAGTAGSDVTLLVAMGAADPGSPAVVALVDAWRREGRSDEAERIAREALYRQPESLAVRIALALALIDLGKLDAARDELQRALAASPEHANASAALSRDRAARAPEPEAPPRRYSVPPPVPAEALELLEEIEADELDGAFDTAESEAEGMLDANEVAQEAIRAVEEGNAGHLLSAPESPFATATMAELLERQGHSDDARAVRARVAPPPELARETGDGRTSDARARQRARVLATLESWLENLRRGAE
jgi:tetratricopeptide (TPR) repeat protein